MSGPPPPHLQKPYPLPRDLEIAVGVHLMSRSQFSVTRDQVRTSNMRHQNNCSCVVFPVPGFASPQPAVLQVEVEMAEGTRNSFTKKTERCPGVRLAQPIGRRRVRRAQPLSIVGRALHVPQVVAHLVRILLNDVEGAERTALGMGCRNVVRCLEGCDAPGIGG